MPKSTILAAALTLITLTAAHARITRLEITGTQPYGSFQAADYTKYDATIHGELSPTTETIPDIGKAPRNAAGMVEYSANVILFIPSDPANGNGALLVDIPNRGKPYAHALYNSPRGLPFQSGNLSPGTGFLEDHGFSIAEVQWELGHGANLPSFTGPDGKPRFIEGVGFAIVRDAADFLAHSPADATGTPNPLAGKISRTIASGKSQTGRFLKTFLLDGFNQVNGHRVIDAMHVFVSGAGLLPIMQSGAGPESSANEAPSFKDPEFPGVNDGPLTIGEIIAKVEARGELPPKMMLINSTVDYLSLRASLGRTGATGTTDLKLPENVRMYDIAGGSHVTVVKADACKLPPNRLDWTPVSRATLLRLDDWVVTDREPPPTRLMSLQSSNGDATVLAAPKVLPKAIIQVPQRDPDGNPVGGVRLPDIAVPLGANGLQNEPPTFTCSLVGAYAPFTPDRLAALYRSQNDYMNQIRLAARTAETDGFLLPEDAAIIINNAAAAPIFTQPPPQRNPR